VQKAAVNTADETKRDVPHLVKRMNSHDVAELKKLEDHYAWFGMDAINGLAFIIRHNKIKSDVILAFIYTHTNPDYNLLHQHYVPGSTTVSPKCPLMVKAFLGKKKVMKPCHVLKIEFPDEGRSLFDERVKMTAIRVNGDMKTPRNISADDAGWKMTKSNGIVYSG